MDRVVDVKPDDDCPFVVQGDPENASVPVGPRHTATTRATTTHVERRKNRFILVGAAVMVNSEIVEGRNQG